MELTKPNDECRLESENECEFKTSMKKMHINSIMINCDDLKSYTQFDLRTGNVKASFHSSQVQRGSSFANSNFVFPMFSDQNVSHI